MEDIEEYSSFDRSLENFVYLFDSFGKELDTKIQKFNQIIFFIEKIIQVNKNQLIIQQILDFLNWAKNISTMLEAQNNSLLIFYERIAYLEKEYSLLSDVEKKDVINFLDSDVQSLETFFNDSSEKLNYEINEFLNSFINYFKNTDVNVPDEIGYEFANIFLENNSRVNNDLEMDKIDKLNASAKVLIEISNLLKEFVHLLDNYEDKYKECVSSLINLNLFQSPSVQMNEIKSGLNKIDYFINESRKNIEITKENIVNFGQKLNEYKNPEILENAIDDEIDEFYKSISVSFLDFASEFLLIPQSHYELLSDICEQINNIFIEVNNNNNYLNYREQFVKEAENHNYNNKNNFVSESNVDNSEVQSKIKNLIEENDRLGKKIDEIKNIPEKFYSFQKELDNENKKKLESIYNVSSKLDDKIMSFDKELNIRNDMLQKKLSDNSQQLKILDERVDNINKKLSSILNLKSEVQNFKNELLNSKHNYQFQTNLQNVSNNETINQESKLANPEFENYVKKRNFKDLVNYLNFFTDTLFKKNQQLIFNQTGKTINSNSNNKFFVEWLKLLKKDLLGELLRKKVVCANKIRGDIFDYIVESKKSNVNWKNDFPLFVDKVINKEKKNYQDFVSLKINETNKIIQKNKLIKS